MDGGAYTSGTNFDKYKGVYKNAWKIIKDDFIKKALDHKISVLLISMVSQEVQTIPVIQVSLVLEESFGKTRKTNCYC